MGRKTYNRDKEWSEVQGLKAENRKLRRQISKLRKVIDRLDIERYQHLKDLLEAHEKEDNKQIYEQQQKNLEKRWECYECGEGILRIIIYNRPDGPHYQRRCDNCGQKTRVKPFHKDVEGVK